LNHRKKTKAAGSRLIPRKHTETLVLLSVHEQYQQMCLQQSKSVCGIQMHWREWLCEKH